jgi:oxygen-independent coproporphyrinogen-3 oxidase
VNFPYSLYLHIPFCVHRCAYCDFNTYAGQEALLPAYAEALIREIRFVAARSEGRVSRVHTVFFGGGTPTLMPPDSLAAVLETIRACFPLDADAEISLEANPGTVSAEGLSKLREAGFNRVSFGMQSAHPEDLRLLERIHDFFDVIESVKWARQAGFENINLDLMYGLPEQPLARWQDSLRRAVSLNVEHLSLYALTLEHGTPFGRWAARGLLPLPDSDAAAEMYEWADGFLAEQGYVQYEISNWAKGDADALTPRFACRHNLQYWRLLPYLGFGAGAHGCAADTRYSNVLRIATYLRRMGAEKARADFPLSPAAVSRHARTREEAMKEMLMLGLRLTREGVSSEGFRARFDAALEEVFGAEIEEGISLGLLEWQKGRIRLTSRARLVGNQVFMRFV